MERKTEVNAGKRFILVVLGSLFLQIFCWAMYSYFEMSIYLCGLSAVITALMYHALQIEEQTGLSRKGVFFAAILTPFLLSAAVTVYQLIRYPQLNLLSASLDGVSPFVELTSLYAARLVINGVVLLIFSAFHKIYLNNHPPKEPTEDPHDEQEKRNA